MPRALTQKERWDRSILERDVQATITDAMTQFGWLWHHETDSRRSPRGLPDLNAVHENGWMAHLEIKRVVRDVTAEQIAWLQRMARVDDILVWGPKSKVFFLVVDQKRQRITGVVRPGNLDQCIRLLRFDFDGGLEDHTRYVFAGGGA